MERIYTIPLGLVYKNPRTIRAKRAVKLVREFISRHMKTQQENVKLSMAVNSFLFIRGMKKPPRKIKVKVSKDKELVSVMLADEKLENKFTKNIRKLVEDKPEEKEKPKENKPEEKKPKKEEKPKENKPEEKKPKEKEKPKEKPKPESKPKEDKNEKKD